MIPFLGVLVQAAILWFIVVWVTQDHNLDWRIVLLWLVLSFGAGMAGYLLGHYILDLDDISSRVIKTILSSATLVFLIWREYRCPIRKVLIILLIFIFVDILLVLPRLLTHLSRS